MTDQMTPEEAVHRAITCLYAQAPDTVVDDVKFKFDAACEYIRTQAATEAIVERDNALAQVAMLRDALGRFATTLETYPEDGPDAEPEVNSWLAEKWWTQFAIPSLQAVEALEAVEKEGRSDES